jgi:hypothetical protein
MNARVGRVGRALEKLTLEVEEARIVIKHRLRELGYEVELTSLTLPEVEVDVYGASDDLCIVGEARVRASSNVLDEIDRKIRELRRLHPDRAQAQGLEGGLHDPSDARPHSEGGEGGGLGPKGCGDVVKPRL